MKITLISPNLVLQKDDPFTTGIPYLPIGLALLAAVLRKKGHEVTVIDSFGLKPNQFRQEGQLLFRGLSSEEVNSKVPSGTDAAFLYAYNVTYHNSVIGLLKGLRRKFPELPIGIFENTQAVTAYSLRHVVEEFFEKGATYVITGEPEERIPAIVEKNLSSVDGIAYKKEGNTFFTPPTKKIEDLDALPFPAWDLFPLENYWKLRYAHGPFRSSRYLPLLSSRGCPYPCEFCIIPETNDLRWRARSPQNVVDEMEEMQKRYGVSEFHFEDVDPTIKDSRTLGICEEILRRQLKVTWKLCSGTKVETLKNEKTIELMAEAGCRYISISPESGSEELMKKMRKPFNYDHAVKMVHAMNKHGIRSQACFVLGFPGETDHDRSLTRKMVLDLTREGVDEIAQFVITPIPGSAIHQQFSGYKEFSELTFSPAWRQDYEKLNSFRIKLYRDFLRWKLRYQPLKLMKQPFNFLLRRFETKMEMTPYRALQTSIRALRAGSL